MKRVITILLTVCMIMTLFAGCGSTKQAETSTGEKTKEVVVTIFHHIGEQSSRDVLKSIIAELEKQNPGVKYEEQGIDFSQYETMLKTKLAGGDAPDIIMGRPKQYGDIIKAGHIMDLSDQPFLDNVTATALDSMKIEGKVYGVPTNFEGMGVFYNKDIFEKEGLEIPTTHNEMITLADKLTEKGIIPFAHGFKEGWTAQCDIQSDLYGSTLAANPTMFKDIMAGNKNFADIPEFVEGVQRNKERISYSSGDDFGTDATKARTMLINGEAAMLIQGTWEIREIATLAPDANIGFFTTPNSNDPEKSLLGLASSGSYMITAQTAHAQEALKFIEFLTTPEGAALNNGDGTQISCVKSAATDQINPMALDVMEIAKTGKTYNYEAEDIFTGQFDATYRKWQEEFAADPKRDVDEYIKKLDKEIDAIK